MREGSRNEGGLTKGLAEMASAMKNSLLSLNKSRRGASVGEV